MQCSAIYRLCNFPPANVPKALFFNNLGRCLPGTKRVSCDAFGDRTSHAVRRIDGVCALLGIARRRAQSSALGPSAQGGFGINTERPELKPRCEALLVVGEAIAELAFVIT